MALSLHTSRVAEAAAPTRAFPLGRPGEKGDQRPSLSLRCAACVPTGNIQSILFSLEEHLDTKRKDFQKFGVFQGV